MTPSGSSPSQSSSSSFVDESRCPLFWLPELLSFFILSNIAITCKLKCCGCTRLVKAHNTICWDLEKEWHAYQSTNYERMPHWRYLNSSHNYETHNSTMRNKNVDLGTKEHPHPSMYYQFMHTSECCINQVKKSRMKTIRYSFKWQP